MKLIFPLSSITINLFITDEVAVTTVVRSPSGHRKRDRLWVGLAYNIKTAYT